MSMRALTGGVFRVLRGIVRQLGYELVIRPRLPVPGEVPRKEYEIIVSHAGYAPWNTDSEFQQVYQVIRANTMIDIYRLWTLWVLARQSLTLSRGACLEVGVWRGGSGALIASAVRNAQPAIPVYLCDTFSGVVGVSKKDPFYRGGEHADTSRDVVERLLQHLQLNHVQIVEGEFPHSATPEMEREVFRLVHIDVDTYGSACATLEWVWSRLLPGSVVILDDYGFPTCRGVTECVHEWVKAHAPECRWVYSLSGQAILIYTGTISHETGSDRE